MTFVNTVENPRARLLYIMGATWHTRCMFDLETREPSFAKLLNQQGISTYAADILGSGPDAKPSTIGNLYQATLDMYSQIIQQHGIDTIMGYSHGCAITSDLVRRHSIKKIIFLDPQARVTLDRVSVNNDKYIISKQSVLKALVNNQTSVDHVTAQDHLRALCSGSEFETASYLVTGQYSKRFEDPEFVSNLLATQRLRTFFTQHSIPHVRFLLQTTATYWPHASHWILLESHRKELAQAVADFVKSDSN